MEVELIPVIEVDTRQPVVAESLSCLMPFAPKMPFYRTMGMNLNTVGALARAHLQGYFDGKWTIEEQCSFFGGYVLRIDGQNALFPQCCGELSDIVYWKHLAKYNCDANYNGHPAPEVTFTTDEVVFNCVSKYEYFEPATASEIRVLKASLSAAYDQALPELEVFARQLEQVQQELPLPVENIAHVLIYHNPDLPDE